MYSIMHLLVITDYSDTQVQHNILLFLQDSTGLCVWLAAVGSQPWRKLCIWSPSGLFLLLSCKLLSPLTQLTHRLAPPAYCLHQSLKVGVFFERTERLILVLSLCLSRWWINQIGSEGTWGLRADEQVTTFHHGVTLTPPHNESYM